MNENGPELLVKPSQEALDHYLKGVSCVGMIPAGHCPCCMKPTELVKVEISYPYSWRRTFLCVDCKDKVVIAISKALESVGLH
jgi:hypothetical protein